ncbi:hypothetical protein N7450_008363 [Penicillium hetheringtonii]|uniref:Uncharacterized protein n=1 Tax=Penicillium hetheringtonii TaxID=911720 RepID=A0AAD6DDL9_9EURO|nr:hypothetical protein N7450_008363 [Penicillium hetheringtonii]
MLYDRLWRRECGDRSSYAEIRGIYGDKEWVDSLDIVNELGGHTGCVNALSWSRSGRLLASGSDDKHLNIYSYQPDSSNAPFALNTTVLTGHKANIFSVKFMPHSNDRTLVTCAGDSQVRVFDIEYASKSANASATSAFAASARSQRFNNFFEGARYLSEGNTNARVYRSHADRVKRIVTESSPHLFLTCSEDGEVRQWDLRQPSSAYPPPRGGQGFMAYRPGLEHDDSNVPPPLISYKKYGLDLNTISCSPSQPHYIALGGAHMHCFLHDRRMLGRDMAAERGSPSVSTPSLGGVADDNMAKATRCVRRFAPRGKHRMRNIDDGHITACKISDANPNEMVVSWSGDHIYSFDLIRSPDARDETPEGRPKIKNSASCRSDSSRNRKRKRPKPTSLSSQGSGDRHHSRRRSAEPNTLRVRYENGETSDISLSNLSDEDESPEAMLEHARNSVLSDAQKLSMDIAKGLVKLRKSLFSLEATTREAMESEQTDLAPRHSFFPALNIASEYLPKMNDVINKWRYPMNPSRETVTFQQTLRHNRQASWRFLQAAGTLAHALEVAGETDNASWKPFLKVSPAPNEDDSIERESQFGYDFLKAILLWLREGRQGLLAGFKQDSLPARIHARFPISVDAGEEAIEAVLVPYLHSLASETPIINVDASRFEVASSRVLFQSQRAAVTAFGNAVKLPLENLGDRAARVDKRRVSNQSSHWRGGILMEAGNGINYSFVNRAFGGLHTAIADESDSDEDEIIERSQDDIDPNVEEEPIRSVHLVRSQRTNPSDTLATTEAVNHDDTTHGSESSSNLVIRGALESQGSQSESEASDASGMEEDDEENEYEEDNEENGWDFNMAATSDEEDDESDLDGPFLQYGGRKSKRRGVEMDVPCSAHSRVYRGHCNIKTVKDVNFFGLNDEYVVSGSDSGHIFIWDRKTTNLINILEGDSEVVNVVQGHPYEPTLAASGIDNTIKIFSPDRHAHEQARQGIDILDPDNPANVLNTNASNIGGLRSCKRIHDSYRIMNQNDVDRRGGMDEAYLTRSMLTRLAATLRSRQGGTLQTDCLPLAGILMKILVL